MEKISENKPSYLTYITTPLGILMTPIWGLVRVLSPAPAKNQNHSAQHDFWQLTRMFPLIPANLLWRVSSNNTTTTTTEAEAIQSLRPVYLVLHDEKSDDCDSKETDIVGVFSDRHDANLRCLGFAQALMQTSSPGEDRHLDRFDESWWWTTADARAGVEFSARGVSNNVYVQAVELNAASAGPLDPVFSPRFYEHY